MKTTVKRGREGEVGCVRGSRNGLRGKSAEREKEQELVGVIWLRVYAACCSQAHLIHTLARSQLSVLLRHTVVLMERCSPHSLLAVVRTRSTPRMHLFKSCFGKPVLRRSEMLLLLFFFFGPAMVPCFFFLSLYIYTCKAWWGLDDLLWMFSLLPEVRSEGMKPATLGTMLLAHS